MAKSPLQMRQDFIDRVDEFGAMVKPFQEIWKTIVLRAAWFECEGAPRPIVISINLAAKPVKHFPKPDHLPEAGQLRVSWETRPANELDSVLKALKGGSIEIAGTTLKLEHRDGTKWAEIGSPFVNFERPGVYYARDREFAEASMREGQSIHDSVYYAVKDRQLEEVWRAMPAPYWDRNDVLTNFFGLPGGAQQDQMILYANATIPMRLADETHLKDGLLTLTVEAPPGIRADKLSVGIIATALDGATRRSELFLRGRTKKGAAQLKKSLKLGKDVARATLLLRYGGVTLERREVLPAGVATANMAMAVHEALDPSSEFYLDGLAGKGKDRGRDFERAVAWLFTFCGFAVVSYAKLNHFDQRAPDVLATSKRDNLILAIECTISSPNTEGKLAKLRDRCRDLRNNLNGKMRVVPVLATALEDSSIPASDRSLAAQDEILLLSFPHLSQLHGLATAGQPLAKIVAYLRKLRGDSKRSVLGQPEADF